MELTAAGRRPAAGRRTSSGLCTPRIRRTARWRRLLVLVTLFVVAGAGTAAADSVARVHRVAAGETLYRIAKQHGVTVTLLQQANGISDPTRLSTGQKLTIPRAYVMRKGDTIYSVGRAHGVEPALILAANEILDPTQVRVGQALIIPESAAPSTPRLAAPPPSATASRGSGTHRLWPTDGARTPLTGKLSGLKISGTVGAVVRSVSSGTVRWASPSRGFGQVVLVENPLGYIYGYLGSAETFVNVGDRVEIGTELGRLGLNPHDHKPNLYFLVFKDGQPADPWQAPRV
jgi:murein DD-endopeptidase MepM/ murein hydrolase activator NlpD